MKDKAAIVTGCNGDIGKAVSKHLHKNDFFVIGIDKLGTKNKYVDNYLKFDFNKIVTDSIYQKSFKKDLLKSFNKLKLELLVNNAAVQHLSHSNTNINKLVESYNVNAISPYLIYKICEKHLVANKGSLINIGSIHSSLTKKQFGFYASSKSALKSINNAIAIDNDGKVSTYLIEPAAIDTKMLRRGFKNRKEINKLSKFHPSGCIGKPVDISNLFLLLHNSKIPFLHGTNIDLSGGIKSLLNDPA